MTGSSKLMAERTTKKTWASCLQQKESWWNFVAMISNLRNFGRWCQRFVEWFVTKILKEAVVVSTRTYLFHRCCPVLHTDIQPCGIWHCYPAVLQIFPPRGRCRAYQLQKGRSWNCGSFPNHPNPKLLIPDLGCHNVQNEAIVLGIYARPWYAIFLVMVITSVQVSLQCPAWPLSPVNLNKKNTLKRLAGTGRSWLSIETNSIGMPGRQAHPNFE